MIGNNCFFTDFPVACRSLTMLKRPTEKTNRKAYEDVWKCSKHFQVENHERFFFSFSGRLPSVRLCASGLDVPRSIAVNEESFDVAERRRGKNEKWLKQSGAGLREWRYILECAYWVSWHVTVDHTLCGSVRACECVCLSICVRVWLSVCGVCLCVIERVTGIKLGTSLTRRRSNARNSRGERSRMWV